MMLAIRLNNQIECKLNHLAAETGRTKSYYVRKALENFLADYEDHLIALARLEKKKPNMSLEEMERKLGLED